MASWRYSSSYTPRDRSGSRDSGLTSKYGLSSSISSSYSSADRPSRWSSSRDPPAPASRSNSIEEHAPVWAKTNNHTSPSSVVQRLKDKYSTPESPKSTSSSTSSTKRAETKDLSLPISRVYCRTLTTNYNSSSNKPSDTKNETNETKSYGDKSKSSSYSRPESEKSTGIFTSRASFRKNTPEPEASSTYEYRTRKPDYTPLESKPKIYTSSSLGSSPATSRYLGKKGSGSSTGSTPNTPTTPSSDRNYILEKFERAQKENEETKVDVVVVTRGTSPSQPSSSIYVRTRRADSARGIERTVQRPKTRPIVCDKECQTDEMIATSTSKFSTYETDKVKPRASYGGITTYTPLSRYSRTSNYPPVTTSRLHDSSEFRRSLSRDRTPAATSTETAAEKLGVKSPPPKLDLPKFTAPSRPTTLTPVKDVSISSSESSRIPKKDVPVEPSAKDRSSPLVISIETRAKSKTPSKSVERVRDRSQTQESDTSISVSGFTEMSKAKSPSQSQKSSTPSSVQKPPPTPTEDESSESESESDETATTTTDEDTGDEVEDLTKSSEPSSIKKSITNFLQNIPNALSNTDSAKSRSKLSLFRGKSDSTAKIKFKHVESGERAWWMDSSGDIPDGVVKLAPSNRSVNHLAPNYLVNRQFSKDKDWLKGSNDETSLSEGSGSSPLHLRPLSTSPLAQSTSPSQSRNNEESTLFLEVPKLPVLRQWSDEIPWWQAENEKNDSASPEKVVNGFSDKYCDSFNKGDNFTNSESFRDSPLRFSPAKSNHHLSERTPTIEEDGEDIDVTPALRRRREQQNAGLLDDTVPDYQKHEEDVKGESKNVVNDCKLECSVRDLTQKLAAVANGLSSPQDEKAALPDASEMSGMISKAKAGLLKSQTKQISRQNSEELSEEIKEVEKAEIDVYWKELVEALSRPLLLGDIDFTDLTAEDEKSLFGTSLVNGGPPPPPPPLAMNGPMPPPIMNGFGPPPAPDGLRNCRIPVPPPQQAQTKNKKTVKLFWKEVTDPPIPSKPTSIWDEISPVSVDGNKLELLFESRAKDLVSKKQHENSRNKAIVVLDNKRSNAINIGMTKLPPPRAIKAAIMKMDSSVINKEGIEKLLTMLPTEEERVRIQDAQVSNPELPLGSAEQFLLTLASISELEARLKLWAFKVEFENSEKEICEPLQDLKMGIEILRNNKTFRAILSTLLSIGNFLNGQEAKGFQIDYLSKVPEVKDTVNKHSLLHHLCVFVMEKFPDSTDLYSEIGSVTRASKTDFDELAANIKKLEDECKCSWNHLKIIAKHEGQTAMKAKMSDFLADCAERIILIGIVHRRIMGRFQKLVLWLGVPMNRISTTRPHELFKTVAEFSLEYRTTRERILQQMKKASHHREKSRPRHAAVNNDSSSGLAKKMNSKEAREDAKLRQLLDNNKTASENFNHTPTWRRHKKQSVSNTVNNEDDSEIIETLIKTAKETPSTKVQERRRSRIMDRKLSSQMLPT